MSQSPPFSRRDLLARCYATARGAGQTARELRRRVGESADLRSLAADMRKQARVGWLLYNWLRGTPYVRVESRCHEAPPGANQLLDALRGLWPLHLGIVAAQLFVAVDVPPQPEELIRAHLKVWLRGVAPGDIVEAALAEVTESTLRRARPMFVST